jgi:hypothetical protein
MDCLDPRMFLILPEHISNAHHVWNYALIITQMSNSATTPNSQLSLANSNGKSQSNQDSSSNTSLNKIINNNNNKNNYTFSFESIINDFKTPNSLNDFNHLLLDEPIQRILKIKKRNKASLYNLIFSKNSHDQISLTELNNLTTPWMLLKPPLQTQPPSSHSNINISSSNTSTCNNINNNNVDKSDNESVASNDEKSNTNNNNNNNNNNTSSNNNINNNVSSSFSSTSSSNSEAEIDLNNYNDGCKR